MADDVIRDIPVSYPAGVNVIDRFDLKKASWGAIWAGVMVTIGMEALFVSFGIFINDLLGGSEIWTMAWYLVTMAVSFYCGSASTVRLSNAALPGVGVLNGLATWGLATLGTIYFGSLAFPAVMALAGVTVPPGTTMATFSADWAGIIWGGIVLSLACAYVGGMKTSPVAGTTVDRTGAAMPLRRAG